MQTRNVLKNIAEITVLSIAVAVGLNCLLLISNLAQYSERYQEAAAVLWAPPIWQQVLYSGLCIPLVEEVVFRGVLYRILRRWLPFMWSALISAVFFGIYHGNLVQFVYAGVCGFLLAYLYEKYHSIVASIWAHMAMNLAAIAFTRLHIFSWIMESVITVCCVIAVCAMVVLYSLYKLHNLDVTKVLNICCKEKSNDI